MKKKQNNQVVIKDMEFLVKELENEWMDSKESKHTVTISIEDAKLYRQILQEYILAYQKELESNADISFKDSMRYCKENYITLRLAKKLIKSYEKSVRKNLREVNFRVDKEEYRLYREMVSY